MSGTGDDRARVRATRPLDWMDTDAAGIWHWSAAVRHLEAAEHLLHRRLGIGPDVSASSPRAHVEVDFTSPVRFGDDVTTEIVVEEVGGSSITYSFSLSVGERTVAAGRLVTVLIDGEGRAARLPDAIRLPLLTAGDVST